MNAATTIIFAREDLSIPGAAEDAGPVRQEPDAVQAYFFDLVSRSNPDVIVLDFSRVPVDGTDTILTIRQRTDIPILVVCDPDRSRIDDYRIAGAVDCIPAPVDIVSLNQTIQKIIRVRGRGRPSLTSGPGGFVFAAMRFHPRRNLLAGENGATADLTTSEGRLLAHFVSKPWILCTRGEIGELLYGPEHAVGDRAIDVVVNRLRKKLVAVGGADAEHLIKTEFRRGYLLITDVAMLPAQAPGRSHALLEQVG
jgi:two-component system, OmpR family, response regulator